MTALDFKLFNFRRAGIVRRSDQRRRRHQNVARTLRTQNRAGDFLQIDQFAAGMDDFAQCIMNDRESRVSGEEGLRDLRAIEAIYRSIANGGSAVRLA